ncbi:MAG: CcoQ/FixQ family Cbb3-type cytochrome c oxidase assembly chaperone [bacterium]|nr:CcoQ/FixQ family Cbb3-type cytochrome c oxidase assembly chaperone [bacterium]
MIRNVLEGIPGIELYPIIALLLFVSFFTILLVWFARADKARLATLARLPLDDDQNSTNTSL